MTNILVITHGNLAKEIIDVAENIIDHPKKAIPVCLDLNLGQTDYTKKISNVIKSLDPEQAVIILTDLFGGTPSNIAIPFVKKDKYEVITGVNLPMLLYLLSQPEDKDFGELCKGAKKAGEEAIIIAGEFLL